MDKCNGLKSLAVTDFLLASLTKNILTYLDQYIKNYLYVKVPIGKRRIDTPAF